jgi:hypothetical protein
MAQDPFITCDSNHTVVLPASKTLSHPVIRNFIASQFPHMETLSPLSLLNDTLTSAETGQHQI